MTTSPVLVGAGEQSPALNPALVRQARVNFRNIDIRNLVDIYCSAQTNNAWISSDPSKTIKTNRPGAIIQTKQRLVKMVTSDKKSPQSDIEALLNGLDLLSRQEGAHKQRTGLICQGKSTPLETIAAIREIILGK